MRHVEFRRQRGQRALATRCPPNTGYRCLSTLASLGGGLWPTRSSVYPRSLVTCCASPAGVVSASSRSRRRMPSASTAETRSGSQLGNGCWTIPAGTERVAMRTTVAGHPTSALRTPRTKSLIPASGCDHSPEISAHASLRRRQEGLEEGALKGARHDRHARAAGGGPADSRRSVAETGGQARL